MIRTLLIIAGASLVLALATLSGAAALGGREMARDGWNWTVNTDDGNSVRFDRVRGGGTEDLGPVTTRTVPWSGGDALSVDLGANVEYVQGDQANVVISGPKGLADRIRFENGRLSMVDGEDRVVFGWNNNGISARTERDELKIVVTAPNVTRFRLNGSQRLEISGYDQPSMTVDVNGSGEISARGTTKALTLSISGSGEADLAQLATEDATVTVSGSGDARLAPTKSGDVTISGSGDVDFSTRPPAVTSRITGSGSFNQG